jgi:hypothetical protein
VVEFDQPTDLLFFTPFSLWYIQAVVADRAISRSNKLGRTKLIARKWSSSQYQNGLAINEQRLVSLCGISTSRMGGRVRFHQS